ncbi:DUF1761 domain-containing protein [Candidatus Woesearchaeota archaeon]|nr:DUF1761 domain-containing protein [Candidatus Woesearchaeota archaeon]
MINYLAVLVAAVASYALGALWYSPVLFEKLWMQLSGLSETKLKEMKEKTDMKKSYAFGFVGTLVSAVVLAYLIEMAQWTSALQGVLLGVLVWLGFVVTVELGSVLWENKSWKLFLLQTGHNLVSLVVMGLVLGLWR